MLTLPFRLTAERATAFLVLGFLFHLARPAHARRTGIQAAGCYACHQATSQSTVTLTPDHDPIAAGDLVNFTATITSPGVKVGGIFVAPPDAGELGTTPGDGLILASGGLTHTSPKAAVGDSVSFQFTWQAPATPGAALLLAYGVAANGNNTNSGDAPGQGFTNFTFGCEPQTFFYDNDGDGHGAISSYTAIGCVDQPPKDYAATHADCNDVNPQVYPGASERCNGKDDNCDGAIDEGAPPEMLYPDPDGDGYYGTPPGDPVVGCAPLAGYASEPGDCAPYDPGRYPGAEEICNLADDDCDGKVDELVRPHCGVGRCEIESPTCDLKDCFPPAPGAERCNSLDDDCNGETDEGDVCPEGSACLGIECVLLDASAGGAASGGAASPAGGSGAIANGAKGGSTSATGGATSMGATNAIGGSSATGTSAGGATSLSGRAGAPAGEQSEPSAANAERGGCGTATGDSSGASALGFAAALLVTLRRRRHGVRK